MLKPAGRVTPDRCSLGRGKADAARNPSEACLLNACRPVSKQTWRRAVSRVLYEPQRGLLRPSPNLQRWERYTYPRIRGQSVAGGSGWACKTDGRPGSAMLSAPGISDVRAEGMLRKQAI